MVALFFVVDVSEKKNPDARDTSRRGLGRVILFLAVNVIPLKF